jgi:DNA-binding PadR family transcriptional regulator
MRQVANLQEPLSEPVFYLLVSLAGEPLHGYALMKEIAEVSAGRVQLSTGTLYGALRRLLDREWIERFDSGDSSRDKQVYRLTSLGRSHLTAEAARLNELARLASARLRAKEAR